MQKLKSGPGSPGKAWIGEFPGRGRPRNSKSNGPDRQRRERESRREGAGSQLGRGCDPNASAKSHQRVKGRGESIKQKRGPRSPRSTKTVDGRECRNRDSLRKSGRRRRVWKKQQQPQACIFLSSVCGGQPAPSPDFVGERRGVNGNQTGGGRQVLFASIVQAVVRAPPPAKPLSFGDY